MGMFWSTKLAAMAPAANDLNMLRGLKAENETLKDSIICKSKNVVFISMAVNRDETIFSRGYVNHINCPTWILKS